MAKPVRNTENSVGGSSLKLQIHDKWILCSNKFRMNPKYPPSAQKSAQNNKDLWRATSHQRSHASTRQIFDCIPEPQSVSASGPQVARKFLFYVHSVSRKCFSSDAQVARRCTQVTQWAPILARVSYMYRRCVSSVLQPPGNTLKGG